MASVSVALVSRANSAGSYDYPKLSEPPVLSIKVGRSGGAIDFPSFPLLVFEFLLDDSRENLRLVWVD